MLNKTKCVVCLEIKDTPLKRDEMGGYVCLTCIDKQLDLFQKLKEENASDIKYLGIPNVCFSLTKPDDDREPDYKKQRIERGFDNSETWSLMNTIANFIIPRLERYEEIAKDVLKREPKLVKDIACFLNALKLISRDEGSFNFTDEEEKQWVKGIKLFPEIFMSLWW